MMRNHMGSESTNSGRNVPVALGGGHGVARSLVRECPTPCPRRDDRGEHRDRLRHSRSDDSRAAAKPARIYSLTVPKLTGTITRTFDAVRKCIGPMPEFSPDMPQTTGITCDPPYESITINYNILDIPGLFWPKPSLLRGDRWCSTFSINNYILVFLSVQSTPSIGPNFGTLTYTRSLFFTTRPTMTEISQGGPRGDSPSTTDTDDCDFTRYAEVNLEDGQVLLYDVEVTEAWIQSDVAIPREDVT